MWKKRIKPKNTIILHELKRLTLENPVKTWINLLLLYMYKDSIDVYKLDQSKGIPPIPHEEELPDGELSFEGIINRLKIMSDLDPVKCKKPKESSFPLILSGNEYLVKVLFDDNNDKSTCIITFTYEN